MPKPCPCNVCARKRVHSRNAYYKRIEAFDRIVPLPPVTEADKTKCKCIFCVNRREYQNIWKLVRRESSGVRSVRLQTPYTPDKVYSWDKTTLADYGPNARRRLVSQSPLHPVVLRTALDAAVAFLLDPVGRLLPSSDLEQTSPNSRPSSATPRVVVLPAPASSEPTRWWPLALRSR